MHRGKIIDDTRLRAHIETIHWLADRGAKVLLLAHLGRPKGKKTAAFSLKPIAARLSTLLNKQVRLIEVGNWALSQKKQQEIQDDLDRMHSGSIRLFENVRFAEGESTNDPDFARLLSSFGDVFVFDGFGVAHRQAASTVGITAYLPSYAGLLVEHECLGLDQFLQKKGHRVALFGGSKVQTKLAAIAGIKKQSDRILLGGIVANTLLAAKGYGVGDSVVDESQFANAKRVLRGSGILLPKDVVVGTRAGGGVRVVSLHPKAHHICDVGEGIFDIGPETVRLYSKELKQAQALLWNGDLGYSEQSPYEHGTQALAKVFAARSTGRAFGVIGGGETIRSMHATKMIEHVDMVSTGGGAMLAYLAGKPLPALEALN
jgi:phosphoglycerate kinase